MKVKVDINEPDLFESMLDEWAYPQIRDFIIKLDSEIQDFEFSIELLKYLMDALEIEGLHFIVTDDEGVFSYKTDDNNDK